MLRRWLPFFSPSSLCAVLFALCSTVPFEGIAEDLPVTGPIPIRNDFPLTAIHLSLEPQTGTVLGDGESRFSATGVWSNTNIVTDTYTIDDESFDSSLEFKRGIGDGVEISAGLPLLWRGGGALDDSIDAWHSFWGFPRGSRDDVDDDRFNIEGVREDARGFKIKDDGFSVGNPTVGGRYQIFRDSENSAVLLGELSLPRFGGSYGHDGLDALAGVALTTRLSWTVLHSGAAAVLFGDDEYDGIPYERVHAEGFIVSENEFAGWPTLLVGLYGGSKTVADISGFPDYFLYLDVGARFPPIYGYALSLSMRENPTPHDGTTDISFVFSIERGWR